uniref:NADH-ubiquinone oxidoreductase chain 2 n=1 Tax=Asymmetron sp. A TK-2007 TaxID=426588 RepID=A7X7F3_9BRAN|nr:NADH dehydrogenase subunit 2 [Asymmetron sp. A TK-2007]BAF76622.1 NADH dehydrogenase subunit 2 [Asymmetron sp. A TK-2007]
MSPYISPLFSLSMVVSLLIILTANHWIFMWLGLEIGTLAFVPLLTWWHKAPEVEAAVKYFLIQAVAAAMFFFGGLALMNSEYINGVSQWLGNAGEVIILFAVLMKLGLAPVHYWVVDVVQGLNYIPGLVLLTWQKLPGLVVLTQLASEMNGTILLMLAPLSALVGGLGGLGQVQVRKLLAFSSIAHLGWLTTGLTVSALLGAMYFLVYIIISLPIFLSLHMSGGVHLNQLRNVLASNPMLSIWVGVGFLSLAGLPPFLGFFSKWLVLTYTTMQILLVSSIILISGALVSMFYYLRISYLCLVILAPQQIMAMTNWRNVSKITLLSIVLLLNIVGLLIVSALSSMTK